MTNLASHSLLDVLNVHMIDVVSGGVVATITHRRARGPVNIIHSENWLVYTYYNDKVRRTELCKWEMVFYTSFTCHECSRSIAFFFLFSFC